MQVKVSILLAVMALAMMMLAGCAGERGLQGEPGTASCFGCHGDDNLEFVAIQEQWQNSAHGSGANTERATAPCSRCHTGEGFLNMISGEDTVSIDNPSAIHCFACHAPHTDGNFNLRAQEPPVLENGGAFDFGEANLCAHCHQSRQPSPAFSSADSLTIPNNRWGPHHSMQADVFAGINAYVFPGDTYDSDSPHNGPTNANGCITCHMAPPFGDEAGGHTWRMQYTSHDQLEDFRTGCNIETCHNGRLEDFSYLGVRDSVGVLLGSLQSMLLDAGFVDDTGLPVPGTYAMDDAGAIYNFLFFEGDRSQGIHNPDYVFDALNASVTHMSTRLLASH